MTATLANAIVDMDNHGYSESLGPESHESYVEWYRLVVVAALMVDRKPDAMSEFEWLRYVEEQRSRALLDLEIA